MCLKGRFIALNVLYLVLYGCQTVQPTGVVAEELILQRVYCGLTDPLDFAYDPADPEVSDTLETVKAIREHNATREFVCNTERLKK